MLNIITIVSKSGFENVVSLSIRYPVYIRAQPRPNGFNNRMDPIMGIRRLFNGRHCADEICCLGRIDLLTLEQIIEDDPNVVIIWR